MKELQVEVTAEDIRNGIAGNPHFCPIALAIHRINQRHGCKLFGPDIKVSSNKVYIEESGIEARFNLDDVGIEFVKKFDTSQGVSPCKFQITLDDKPY